MRFEEERARKARQNWNSAKVRAEASRWHDFSRTVDYQYMFDWSGLPIIQDPQDVLMVHEVLWHYNPTVILETGIARGGSLMLSAEILAALSFVDSSVSRSPRKVIGVDIDIRPENKTAVENHRLGQLIHMIEGSSIEPHVIAKVGELIEPGARVAVLLDSNHTHDHVLAELVAYSPLVIQGGPIIVMDTGIEFAPVDSFATRRPWGPGNSPHSAVRAFLASQAGDGFTIDTTYQERHLISAARDGLLRRKW